MSSRLSRRNVLEFLCAGAVASVGSTVARADAFGYPKPAIAPAGKFLWGAATSGHQVEGNCVNDDDWLLEQLPDSMFKQPSGDACDQYHLFAEDIAMLASFGLNAYRFSIEWSRIEPTRGAFSQAEMTHYQRVLEACHQHGVTPLVTYNHDAVPRWFAEQGAWGSQDAPALFARYCGFVTRNVGDLIGYAMTLNEPDLPMLFRWLELAPGMTLSQMNMRKLAQVRQQTGCATFNNYFLDDPRTMVPVMLQAHKTSRQAIKAERSGLPVGFCLAIEDDQDPLPSMHAESGVAAKRREVYEPWWAVAKSDEFIGVQNYSRAFVGPTKNLQPPPGALVGQTGQEFYPESLQHTIRLTAKETGVPVLVTEHGMATDDDTQRVRLIQQAVAGVQQCRRDGVDVRSYVHWSLLDNFEWIFGYGPKYGLVAVDRATQKRTPKPSASVLGQMARTTTM